MNKQIDWFQIHVKLSKQFHAGAALNDSNLIRKKMDYGTKHFRAIDEIFDKRYPSKRVASIAYIPNSTALPAFMGIIKFDNWLLYQVYSYRYILDFITFNEFDFQNLTRVDIAIDFNFLDYRNIHPERFIKKFLCEDYTKVRKSKFHVIGNNGDRHYYQYLKFGSAKSRVCSYIYNKTKELEEVENKPHIREAWERNGLTGEIWRCEFRIQDFDFLLTDTDTGEQISYNGSVSGLNSLDILKPEVSNNVFNALADHYLHFKINGNDTNKTRLQSFKIFNTDGTKLFNRVYNEQHESNRSTKIFLKKLYELNNEMRGTDYEFSIEQNNLINKMIDAHRLEEWAAKKGIKE